MKELKIVRYIFNFIAILVLLVGLFFSYVIAVFDDAPGMLILGPTFTLMGSSLIYGFGELIIIFKKNNQLLVEIKNRLNKK